MRLLYVTDTKLFYNEHGIYKKAYLEPDELGALNDNITEIAFWGRLYYVKDTDGLSPLKSDKYKLTVFGNKNQKSGLLGYVLGLFKMFKGLGKEVKSADIIWLKFPFFSSYVASLFLTEKARQKKVVLSQLVGDFNCILLIYPGLIFKLLVNLSKCLYRKIIKKCDLQVYVSRMLEDEYKIRNVKSMIVNENRVKSRDIVDFEKVPLREKWEPLRLIFAGRLSPEKRVFDIINAAQSTDNVTLSIIGGGIQKSQISDYVASHALKNKMSVRDALPWGEDLFSFIKTHHALVLPSQSEGLPLVLLEAMSCGVSVIASRVGGTPEIVKDGTNGQIFEVGNIGELKKCVEKIRDNETLRREFIKNGLATAHQNCFETQLTLLSDAVGEILETKKAH